MLTGRDEPSFENVDPTSGNVRGEALSKKSCICEHSGGSHE